MSAETPFVLVQATVETAERMSPSFVRVTFSGSDLGSMGSPGRTLDQRVKILFPGVSGTLPELSGAGDDWHRAWLALPENGRGTLRTYSIRELIVDDTVTKVVIDFVLHLDSGSAGPASLWASTARPGGEVLIFGPRRGRSDGVGVEYLPGAARRIHLVGDETAAPAIARILEDIDRDAHGVAFIEVPNEADVLSIDAPAGVQVRWLPRSGLAHGALLIPSVLDYLGADASAIDNDDPAEDLLWETPTYSGLGEDIRETSHGVDRYFWIAGESGVVTTLRRHLVHDLSIDRANVAFMGYWRRGVAMHA